jgi:hypothetical protein
MLKFKKRCCFKIQSRNLYKNFFFQTRLGKFSVEKPLQRVDPVTIVSEEEHFNQYTVFIDQFFFCCIKMFVEVELSKKMTILLLKSSHFKMKKLSVTRKS